MAEPERLDRLLLSRYPDFSRSRIEGLVKAGFVTVNGAVAGKAGMKVSDGDDIEVEIPPPVPAVPQPEDIPLDIVFEDADMLVLNKAPGMVVHPAPGHHSGTLVNALLFHCPGLSGIGGVARPGIVHRLDRYTSGLMAVAKSQKAMDGLVRAFAGHHDVRKTYLAICHGRPRLDSGRNENLIGRHPADRKRMAIVERTGRPAVTHWEVLTRYNGYTQIRCRLETGRTHQIRVHMASIGHPLLGDGVYGAPSPEKGLEGQCLHARELKFVHPRTGEHVHLVTELPTWFTDVLARLGPETA